MRRVRAQYKQYTRVYTHRLPVITTPRYNNYNGRLVRDIDACQRRWWHVVVAVAVAVVVVGVVVVSPPLYANRRDIAIVFTTTERLLPAWTFSANKRGKPVDGGRPNDSGAGR